ncbi:hypothetical protein BCF53_1502 [Reinekea marinisedimentorum]|uniref:Uncharacterized protein n=2 Tax=Reinekea marinisedimentorum TaxID=230495 RepID=A0A4R3HPZ6_9GAMM|nr:hypothetical protein BCF53_1502 [Reinekea marinisedimentorum]
MGTSYKKKMGGKFEQLFEDKEAYFSDGYEKSAEYNPEIAYERYLSSRSDEPTVIKTRKNVSKIAKYIDFKKNITAEMILNKDTQFMIFRVLGSGIIGSKEANGHTIRFYDFAFNERWCRVFEPKERPLALGKNRFLDYGDSAVVNLCMERDVTVSSYGEVCCLSLTDGASKWSASFPHAVDSIEKESDSTLLVLASGTLYRLSALTGEVLQTLSTGFENRLRKHFTFMADEYCFLFSIVNKLMHVVDLECFSIVKTLDLQDRKETFYHNEMLKIDRSVYFQMNASSYQKITAEVNLDTLDLTYEDEHQPNLNISIPTKGYEPITITTEGEYLGDLLRYLEFTVLELAEREGNQGRGLSFNKHFDGVISVTCLNTDADGFSLDDCFRRLKYVIENDAASWGIFCGKGKNPITFEYKFES